MYFEGLDQRGCGFCAWLVLLRYFNTEKHCNYPLQALVTQQFFIEPYLFHRAPHT